MNKRMKYLLCALGLVSMTLRADWVDDSNAITLELLRAQAAFSPESASYYGLEDMDEGVMDLGKDIYQRRRSVNEALLVDLRSRLESAEHPRLREDLQILVRSVEDELESLALRREQLIPYYDLHGSLFQSFSLLLDPQVTPERQSAVLTRLARYVGAEAGYRPITEQARARSSERFAVPGLLGPWRGEIEGDLANVPPLVAGIRSLFEASSLDGWQDNLATLENQLADYVQWLRTEMMPRARAENPPPAAIYADNLKQFGVRATPEELIANAQYAYQFIRSEMKALAVRIAADRGWDDDRLVPVMRRLKTEQIAEEDILGVYQQRLAEIEAIIEREDIVSLPEREAVIRLATPAEAAASPASFMRPPQLIGNTGQYGEFVLVQSNPSLGADSAMDDWGHAAITWALTVHEARPGHELQFSTLVENGTSLARVIYAMNSANVEGWGLYAEALMHEYLPLEGQLFNLFTRLARAARMFLDPMVNTGQLSHAEAVEFMTTQMALSPAMADSEADRYAFRMPGQATAYYYGYMNLMRLRTEVELALGDAFNQRTFHDAVLAQGLLPTDLLSAAVLAEFGVSR